MDWLSKTAADQPKRTNLLKQNVSILFKGTILRPEIHICFLDMITMIIPFLVSFFSDMSINIIKHPYPEW